jgi:hypothetical protein
MFQSSFGLFYEYSPCSCVFCRFDGCQRWERFSGLSKSAQYPTPLHHCTALHLPKLVWISEARSRRRGVTMVTKAATRLLRIQRAGRWRRLLPEVSNLFQALQRRAAAPHGCGWQLTLRRVPRPTILLFLSIAPISALISACDKVSLEFCFEPGFPVDGVDSSSFAVTQEYLDGRV